MVELPKTHYATLSKYLNEVPFNVLFASAVLDRAVSGRVYVDNVTHPHSFYIVHRYGMSLLGGDATNVEFNLALREYALNSAGTRTEHEWMQVYPNSWNIVLKELLGDKLVTPGHDNVKITRSVVELNTRVNFVFNKDLYLKNRDQKRSTPGIRIVDTTAEIYDQMHGTVVPSAFWNTPKDFVEKGVSFSLYYEGRLACTSFSSFVAPGKLELGIETSPEFRGLGLAEKTCAALIDYCIERNLEPIWACRLENTGSYKLALKLGFIPRIEIPYYRLSN